VANVELEELSIQQLLAFVEAEEGEAGEEEEGEAPNPVLPTGNEIIWAAVFFFALWAAMKYVLLPPIMKTRAEREAKIAAARDLADGGSGDLAAVQAAYDEKINAAKAEATALVDAARTEAEAERATLVNAAEAEIAQLRSGAQAEIAAARTAALSGLKGDVATVAAGAATTVVGRPVDAGSAGTVLDRILNGASS
jgi:F-type H+-transporting ATPase subunit b